MSPLRQTNIDLASHIGEQVIRSTIGTHTDVSGSAGGQPAIVIPLWNWNRVRVTEAGAWMSAFDRTSANETLTFNLVAADADTEDPSQPGLTAVTVKSSIGVVAETFAKNLHVFRPAGGIIDYTRERFEKAFPTAARRNGTTPYALLALVATMSGTTPSFAGQFWCRFKVWGPKD